MSSDVVATIANSQLSVTKAEIILAIFKPYQMLLCRLIST